MPISARAKVTETGYLRPGTIYLTSDLRLSLLSQVFPCARELACGRLRPTDDNETLAAGLDGVQPYLVEAEGGQLTGEILGLVAGETVGGVTARSRRGLAL